MLLVWAAGGPSGAAAQEETDAGEDAYVDETARALMSRARAGWWEMDRDILSYEALVRQRLAINLRTPLKDRTLFRSEAASRVYWSVDDEKVVQVLAAKETHPGGVNDPEKVSGVVDEVFDPAGDRIYFGFTHGDDDEVWVEHPVAPGSEAHYRFRTGDTLTLSLQDGRRIRAVEVEILPRQASFHLLSGALWIEPESGALVRAVYRLSATVDIVDDLGALDDEPDDDVPLPGLFLPMEFEMSLATVEYGLWNFRHWLPRRTRVEGLARAGILEAPASFEVTYRILDVVAADDPDAHGAPEDGASVAARWLGDGRYGDYEMEGASRMRDGDRVRVLLPVDRTRLHTSEHLPPPIWREAPGFATDSELAALYEELGGTPAPGQVPARPKLHWGLQRPGLVRYNRVEGLSVGARGTATVASPAGPVSLEGVARVGVPEGLVDVGAAAAWEGVRRRVELAGYHRVAEVDPRARNLGPGNSATALFFGRDDGDYYRASGARLSLLPASERRTSWRIDLSAEEHGLLAPSHGFALSRWVGGESDPFRDNVQADEGRELAATVRYSPWWGSDARGAQGGLELLLHAATGDRDFARSRLVARVAVPVVAGLRLGFEGAGGTAWGDLPIQRAWFLGGSRTLRGYAGASAVGPTFVRGRVEAARQFDGFSLAAFSDGGWAGPRDRVRLDDALLSAGLGASVLDGLVRIDLARALRAPEGWRLELYLDALL